MSYAEPDMAPEAARYSAKSVGSANMISPVADAPLTLKVSDMLDEAMKRLHSAESALNGISYRLFGDNNSEAENAKASATPSDFSGMITERLHYLIGLAGNIASATNRLDSRL
jgi:hypothetical protein